MRKVIEYKKKGFSFTSLQNKYSVFFYLALFKILITFKLLNFN
jgi:hypothetical protein